MELLFPDVKIGRVVAELAWKIDLKALPDLVLVGVLKGAYVFMADLTRSMQTLHTVDFLEVQSYRGGTKSMGQVELVRDLSLDIRGKNVIVVEDIYDTGKTWKFLKPHLEIRQPKSLALLALVKKRSHPDLLYPEDILTVSEGVFVVGYGMDHLGKMRNLPHIFAL
jgi:hypoxanthine phosphoribosyltransferase